MRRLIWKLLALTTLIVLVGIIFWPTTLGMAQTRGRTTQPPATLLITLPPPVLAESMRLNGPADVGGRLVFFMDGNLYIAGLDGNPAYLLQSKVSGFVLPAPNKRAIQVNDNLFGLSTLEVLLAAAGMGYWSPDGAWVSYPFTVSLPLETGAAHTIENGAVIGFGEGAPPQIVNVAISGYWMTDNRLLSIHQMPTPNLSAFDPVTGETEIVSISEEEFYETLNQMFTYETLDATNQFLAEKGFAPLWNLSQPRDRMAWSPNRESFARVNPAAACNSVRLERMGADGSPLEILAETDGFINDVVWTAGDTIYYVQWAVDDCAANPRTYRAANLYQLAPGGTPILITDELVINQRLYHYDLSPDLRYLVWAGYDKVALESYLAVLDLVSGDTTRLMSVPAPTMPIGSQADIGFSSVFWVE